MNLTKTNWKAGWDPSADAVNGSPDALLRMDNLRLDKEGVLGLIDGMLELPISLPDYADNLYSKIVNGIEYVWVAAGDPPSAVNRYDAENFPVPLQTQLVTGAGTPSERTCFGDGLGNIFTCAGNLRVKDPISSLPLPLGLLSPQSTTGEGPTGFVNNQQFITISCPESALEGTTDGGVVLTNDPTTFEGAMVTGTAFGPLDTTNIGGLGPSLTPGADIISFPFTVAAPNISSVISGVEIDFLLQGDPLDPTTWTDYYSLFFDNDFIVSGLDLGQTLSRARQEFTRVGVNQNLNWTTVIGVRFLFQATDSCTCGFGDITITGGAPGGLNGVYNYIQVNVCNNGTYLAKSPPSAPAKTSTDPNAGIDFYVINGSVSLEPYTNDLNANEYWFYRIANMYLGVDPVTGQSLNASSLSQYYYVGKMTHSQIAGGATLFTDSLSDIEVLQLNADGSLLPNLYLQTLRVEDTTSNYFTNNPSAMSDTIFAMEGVYNERMIYMGISYVYVSDRLNPDGIDSRYTLKMSGDPTERNLWIKKLTNNMLMLATTKDLYEISGTLTVAPDGTMDVQLIALGEAKPPISPDVCNFTGIAANLPFLAATGGGLYYIASDGLRVTSGSNSVNVSPQLRQLFQNSIAYPNTTMRHGVPGVKVYEGGTVNYSLAATNQKIYMALPMQDSTRRVIVYDTVTRTYEVRLADPVRLWTTQSGELLAAYGNPNSVWILDYQAGFGVQNVAGGINQGLPFRMRTVFDANQQPRNRKDTFTLKLILDTGGANVSVDIQKDGAGVTETDETLWTNLGQFSSSGQNTIYIPLSSNLVTLGFRYSIQISDVSGVYTFKLYELTIEYEARPEQVNYMRILPTNSGTVCRKRWTAFAFVIDTLGFFVQFTPFLDNVAWPRTITFQTGTKLTYIFYFESEAIATDVGGILQGYAAPGAPAASASVFEFYQVSLEECISEKLPSPTTFLVIPANDYGTPNRKRHTSYKFQILTRGASVLFTPRLDGVWYPSTTYSTSIKQTVEYFFPLGDIIGIDVGGTLASLGNQPLTPFEFYGVIVPQKIEQLPDRLEYYRIPNSNYGVAAPKRLRTLPMVIDTYGKPVTFIPIIDGVLQTTVTTLVTSGKTTTYHFFTNDVFGTDFGGILQSTAGSPFEFYELSQPEDVEVLPVPKKLDMLGPMRFDKIAKIFGFRIHLIMNGTTTSVPYTLYGDYSTVNGPMQTPLYSGTFPVVPGVDMVPEIFFPRSINTDIARLVVGPTTDTFHRYDVLMKVQTSGMESESKWQPFR